MIFAVHALQDSKGYLSTRTLVLFATFEAFNNWASSGPRKHIVLGPSKIDGIDLTTINGGISHIISSERKMLSAPIVRVPYTTHEIVISE